MKLRKTCEYAGDVVPGSAAADPSVDGRLQQLERLLNVVAPGSRESSSSTSSTRTLPAIPGPDQAFPRAFFLDAESFSPVPNNALAPPPQSPLRQAALEYLGHDYAAVCTAYFAATHTWLPILSRKRLMHELSGHSPGDASTLLLILCMKLCVMDVGTQSPPQDNVVYLQARHLCSATEMAGYVSLRLLQCLTLLSLYELSHAIFPAASLTASRAARLGILMGLHGKSSDAHLFKPPDTWTLREEQRRAWWAVFILDRYGSSMFLHAWNYLGTACPSSSRV